MKKQAILFMCILLLAACSPKQTNSQETVLPIESSSNIISSNESTPQSVPEIIKEEKSTPTSSEAPLVSEIKPIDVESSLEIIYGNPPTFSQKLSVPPNLTFRGDKNTITVERKTTNGWQKVHDSNTGNFTLEGKVTVKGPLPIQVLKDSASDVQYRLTTLLYTDNGSVRAINTFNANDITIEETELLLNQTSFVMGNIPLRIYLENKSQESIVVSKLRVYNVNDGENLLPDKFEFRETIVAGAVISAFNDTLTLEPGEYVAEVMSLTQNSGIQIPLSKNFTVVKKLKNPASATTVEMKVSVDNQIEDTLASFTQTFTNNSCQTLLIGQDFRVEQQLGIWTKVEYPLGNAPVFPEDLVLLRPTETVTFNGTLPFTEKDMPPMYRIVRTLQVENPLSAQKNGLTLVYTVTNK